MFHEKSAFHFLSEVDEAILLKLTFIFSVYLIVLRAFMCTAMILSFLACTFTLVGLECSRVLEDQLTRKRLLMFVSGGMHITAGKWFVAHVPGRKHIATTFFKGASIIAVALNNHLFFPHTIYF